MPLVPLRLKKSLGSRYPASYRSLAPPPEAFLGLWLPQPWGAGEAVSSCFRCQSCFSEREQFGQSEPGDVPAMTDLLIRCQIRDRECWHWIRDTQIHEDAHRYRGDGAGALASLQSADEPGKTQPLDRHTPEPIGVAHICRCLCSSQCRAQDFSLNS